jgi:glycosyltransferase involved in cell wall biosynthesis
MLRRLKRAGRLDVLDAHFAYPDGYAATLVGRWLGVPVTITLRGTESRHAGAFGFRTLVRAALTRARRVFAVADALKRVAISLGIPEQKVLVVGNGVDTAVFRPVDRDEARRALGLPLDAPVVVTVGGLVERKGFHRVIEQLPALQARLPGLRYLIVGGPSPEGDFSSRLREQVAELGLGDSVRFLGAMAPAELPAPLSAADVFVLATRNEGWANVLLEAMACGLPVVTTDVGGNAEVVSSDTLGTLVPFGNGDALRAAIATALAKRWDRQAIIEHARANAWDGRIARLVDEFRALAETPADPGGLRVGASPR